MNFVFVENVLMGILQFLHIEVKNVFSIALFYSLSFTFLPLWESFSRSFAGMYEKDLHVGLTNM